MSNTENSSSVRTMVIHLSDRPPIEIAINTDEWSIESNLALIICEKMEAHMTVIKSSEKYVVYAGAYEVGSSEVIFEGGYLLSKKKKRHKEKIFSKLNWLFYHMGEKAKEHISRNQSVIHSGEVMRKLDEMLKSVKRGMPPERI